MMFDRVVEWLLLLVFLLAVFVGGLAVSLLVAAWVTR